MKFMVSRVSSWDDTQPCAEAFQETFIRVDGRTVDDPSKLKHPMDRETWYKKGTNHRVEDGHIKRDFEATGWFININSLEELIKFHEKYGDLVITESTWNKDIIEIEIYDSWRE